MNDARGLNAVEIGALSLSGGFFTVLDNLRVDSVTSIHPTGFAESPGLILAGDLGSLISSDDNKLVSRPGVVLSSTQAPISLVVEGIAPSSSASVLTAVVESSANQANIGESIDAYNFVTGTYDSMTFEEPLSTTDFARVVEVPNPSDHIGPGNLVRTRLKYKALGPVLTYPWQVQNDEVSWRVRL
jgi:hypothetical protein